MTNPNGLMAEDTLYSAHRAISSALRCLKELESPDLRSAAGIPAGGPHREAAMHYLRDALREVGDAILYHHLEQHGVVGRPRGAQEAA